MACHRDTTIGLIEGFDVEASLPNLPKTITPYPMRMRQRSAIMIIVSLASAMGSPTTMVITIIAIILIALQTRVSWHAMFWLFIFAAVKLQINGFICWVHLHIFCVVDVFCLSEKDQSTVFRSNFSAINFLPIFVIVMLYGASHPADRKAKHIDVMML